MKDYAKLLALVAGCVLALLGAPASAQDKPIELKLSHWGPPTHVNQKVFLPWAEMVEKKSGGKLKVTVFAGGVLGKPADHWDMGAEQRGRHFLGHAQLHGRALPADLGHGSARS